MGRRLILEGRVRQYAAYADENLGPTRRERTARHPRGTTGFPSVLYDLSRAAALELAVVSDQWVSRERFGR